MSEQQSTDTSTEKKPPQEGAEGGGGDQGEIQKRLDHVLKDMHRYKEAAKTAETELQRVKEAKLKEQNDWKTLYEQADAKAATSVAESEKLKASYLGEKKYSAVKEAALKAGLRAEASQDLEILNLEGVEVEATSTGRLNVLGADLFVEKLKATRPHWFGGKAPGVNGGVPSVTGTKEITVTDLTKAEREAKRTGDHSKYEAVMKQYRSQKK